MSQAPYSPVMLIAADGLIQNLGLAINGNLSLAVNNYNSTSTVSLYTGVLSSAAAAIGPANTQISLSTFTSLQTLAGDILPAVTNAVTPAYISAFGSPANTYTGGLSGLVVGQADTILGSGDLGKFAQIYNAAESYAYTNNQIVDSLVNSDLIANTFTNMSALTTGEVSDVNSNLPAFAADLSRLGQAWNMRRLDYLGYPSELVYQMYQVAGLLPEFVNRLTNNGVTETMLSNLVQSGLPIAADINARIYAVMQTVTGSLLDQIKVLLDVTTPGLTTMADLLNPVKTLPNSYRTLTIRMPTGSSQPPLSTLVNIYLENNTVNSNLKILFVENDTYTELLKIIPADQALANRALATTLLQIKNIFVPSLPEFAAATALVETDQDLNRIQSLTEPIPPAVKTSLNDLLATGSGPNGTLTLFDLLGVAAGVPYANTYNSVTAGINQLQTDGQLTVLTDSASGVWAVMQNTLDGDYTIIANIGPPEETVVTIPAGLPGAGSYATVDDAFVSGLIPAAANLIQGIVANNSSEANSLNSGINSITVALVNEKQNLELAQVDFGNLTPNSRSSVTSLAFNLHSIGTDVGPTGSAVFFDAIADRSNIYGQAIVAAMREGRNIETLNEVGIDLDTQIPITPTS